jgi:soluble lytic murein transglycosylase
MRAVSFKKALKVMYWNLVAAVLVMAIGAALVFQRIHRFDTLIIEAGKKYGIDARLVSAVIWRESRFRPGIIGPKDEIGLMQITEAAAAEWALDRGIPMPSRAELFEPAQNIDVGAWYLARAIRRWAPRTDDPLPFALAEYNAGRTNAEQWAAQTAQARAFWEGIPFPTTKRYVRDILRRYRRGV